MNSIRRLIRLVIFYGGVKLLLKIVLRLKKGLREVNKMYRKYQSLIKRCN